MRIKTAIVAFLLLAVSAWALADLEPWKDYEVSDTVYSVTTVRVKPNMDDAYLEGIRDTWARSFETAKELGQIVDYRIYRSALPQSGDFNLLLVVEYENLEAMSPEEGRYNAFVEAMSREALDENNARAQRDYPGMREITGEYVMRQVMLK